jgi:sulfate ABC transporter ATP-binding protein
MSVQIRGLTRRYGREVALAAIDVEVGDGELLALLGPSGAGKTTLLRLIAGLDRPDDGTVSIDGRDVCRLSPRARQIGFVFQNYALFRHMNVAHNIAFGLNIKPRRDRPSRAAIAARVEELLDLMQLSGLGRRFPAQLSGGQRQRAALARALAIDPKVLLLDEPFGALDAKVRAELREWLRDLQHRLRLTTIFVTHDQHEAFQLADRVAILNEGRIIQAGTPAQLHARPETPFVADFLRAAHHTAAGGDADKTAKPDRAETSAESGRLALASGAAHLTCRLADWHNREPPGGGNAATPGGAHRHCTASRAADSPVVAAGELWVLELTAGSLSSFEFGIIAAANVVIYDRALAEVVAAVLPLGGYAEPALGDTPARCLQFARDGWSVVRIVDRAAGLAAEVRRLTMRLRAVGAPDDLGVSWLIRGAGTRPAESEETLAGIDTALDDIDDSAIAALRFRAFGSSKTALHRAATANGLAG